MEIQEQTKRNLRCSHCGANPNMDIEEIFECIESCTNCLADLQGRGVWRNTALNLMEYLIKKHGFKTVKLYYLQHKFQKV